MYLPSIPGGILGDSRAAAVLSGAFPLGKREKEGDVRGGIIPEDHWAHLHALAEEYGEAVRLGEGRETRNA